MKSIEVIYKNGQLVDVESKKQVHLFPGKSYFINGDDDAFLEKDFLDDEIKPLDAEQKKKQLLKDHKGFILEKILETDTKLYFRIGLRKVTTEDKTKEYLFEATLLEDLYLMSKSHDKLKWSLCECQCECSDLVDGRLDFFHPIKGSSLANLFANMVTYYFAGKRSTACNAFETYAFSSHNEKIDLFWYKMHIPFTLDFLRDVIIEKYREERN